VKLDDRYRSRNEGGRAGQFSSKERIDSTPSTHFSNIKLAHGDTTNAMLLSSGSDQPINATSPVPLNPLKWAVHRYVKLVY